MQSYPRPHFLAVPLVVLALAGTAHGADQAPGAAPLPRMPANHPPMTTAKAPAVRLAPETVLARWDTQAVTVSDVDAALARAPGEVRSEYRSPEAIAELVGSLADRKLMAAAARASGIEAEPGVQQAMSSGRDAGIPADFVLADAWLDRQLAAVSPATEADVERYYREHSGAFTEPKRVYVTRVVATSVPAAGELRAALARGIAPGELRDRFPAALRSIDQVWLQDGPAATDLTVLALGLEPGDVSPMIPVGTGPAMVRVEQKKPERLLPLPEVRGAILTILGDQARTERGRLAVQELRKRSPVTLEHIAIDSYSRSLQPPAATPAGAE